MKLKTFVLSLLVLFSISSHAQDETAYAVWCAGNTTLYFTSRAEALTAGDSFIPEGSTEAVTITNVWNGTAVTVSADTPGVGRCVSVLRESDQVDIDFRFRKEDYAGHASQLCPRKVCPCKHGPINCGQYGSGQVGR